ncbi:GNAT family N-acetyltransferase [Myceligenerans pegani]|uniref:GNAT family N-acetyltransferase n=1 Tax=Myceligenerans pegani TaxID=2776917 RepID=A0ABR9N2L2_9MICO|nr:GNAT family N-acetyltransferase [Myceligenerans sp. TRM 65318]MBE1877343.1 GNAT family N-acetyltransferase [Myceligenerans sp. TRM 65318]MBE3019614.1 GNAT family N-acetyltransferase [Myceligenerans sp. TRM 65318]
MRIIEAPHPPSLDHPDAWAYHGIGRVAEVVAQETWGVSDTAMSANDVLVTMSNQQYADKVRLVAVEDDGGGDGGAPAVVGHVVVILPTQANKHLGMAEVQVVPDAWDTGTGQALLDAGIERVRAAGRTTMLLGVDFGEEDPDETEWVTASSGKGRVAAGLPAIRLARSLGFECAIVERKSLLELPLAPGALEAFEAESRAVAGDAYRLHTWRDHIPEDWLDAYAALETALAADEPRGDQDIETDPWDAERVRNADAQHAARGNGYVITAAEHVASGELAGMTMLLYPKDETREYAEQEATVVLRAHRGHRLGMLVKAVNAQALLEAKPNAKRVWTWNNEENPHMLAINVAMGFRPAGGCAEMQRKV